MSLLSLFLFLVVLLVLVIVHEFGHFIVAKLVNMRVDEFAFGFPPRLFSKKKGETHYSINALPLGGYVSIWGENGEPNDEAKHHPRAFSNRPKWAQVAVLVAGVAMNMLLALVIFIGVSFGKVQMSADDPVYGSRVKNPVVMVTDTAPSSPAQRVGIVPGSTIVSVKSGRVSADMHSATSVIAFVGAHQNDAFTITFVTPSGVQAQTTIAAVYGILPEKKALGLALESVGTVALSPWEAVKVGTVRTYDMTKLTLVGLGSLVKSFEKGNNVLTSLSGPVGIARIVGQTSDYGISAVLTLVAILSINLAIFNALPFPALDGGRIVVVAIEAIIRRRVPFKYYSWANTVGFALLMILLVIVTVHDIRG